MHLTFFIHPMLQFDTFDGQKNTPWQTVFQEDDFPHGFSLNISLPVTRGSSSGAAWREAGGWILAMTHGTLSVFFYDFQWNINSHPFQHRRKWRNTMKCNFVPFRVKFPKVWWLHGSVESFKRWNGAYLPVTPKTHPFCRLSHLHDLHEASSTGLGWWPNINVWIRHVMIVGFYQFCFRLLLRMPFFGSVMIFLWVSQFLVEKRTQSKQPNNSVVVFTWSLKVYSPEKTNMTMDNEPFRSMHLLFNMVIFGRVPMHTNANINENSIW